MTLRYIIHQTELNTQNRTHPISKLALSSKMNTDEVNDEEKFLTLIYPHVSSSYEKDLKS